MKSGKQKSSKLKPEGNSSRIFETSLNQIREVRFKCATMNNSRLQKEEKGIADVRKHYICENKLKYY